LIKNTASQVVEALMLLTATGLPATSKTVAVWVRKDGGAATVGSGSVTEVHATNYPGVYSYAPSQAETNADYVTFLFTNADSLSVLVAERTFDPARVGAANVTQIDGTANASATLTIKQLVVANSSGNAVEFTSTGSNGRGIVITGHGTSSAMRLVGGATGPALMLVGGSTSGAGLQVTTTNGHGFDITGGGTNSGISITGGATGVGLTVNGGSTSGSAVVLTAPGSSGYALRGVAAGNDSAFSLQGSGTGSGFALTGGATGTGMTINGGANGIGLAINGGSSSGAGFSITTTDGHGITISASGSGKYDIDADNWGSINIPTRLNAVPTAAENATGLLDLANAVDGETLRQLLRLFGAVLVGKTEGAGTSTEKFYAADGSKVRVTSTVTSVGERQAVTLEHGA
jgi:hypothetical protein